MNVGNVNGGAVGDGAQPGETGKPVAKIQDAEEFAALMKKAQEDKEAGRELDKDDLQSMLRYTIKESVAAAGRRMQDAAKDIQRENIDKGF